MKDWLCETCLHREQDEAVCESCEPEDPVRSCYTSVRARFGTQYKDTRVQCPFYKWAKTKHRLLCCEGPIEDSSVTVFFKRMELLEDYLHGRCEDDFKSCPVYQIAIAKYETEG
jgi:hypothetical protein